jgi:cellulose synthase/poly-beta-1,6-N-acetylglucosamine synthase-like glycosyltransferase
MKTILFFLMVAITLAYFLARLRVRPSLNFGSIDVIVPAFNEQPVIAQSLINLLRNPYVRRVICVDDGSTDGTADVVAKLAEQTPELILVRKEMAARAVPSWRGWRMSRPTRSS